MQLCQFHIGLIRIRDQELIHDTVCQHRAHDMSEQALDHNPQSGVVETLLRQT